MRHDVVIAGEQISLRPVLEEDLPHWVEWLNDAEVTKHLGSNMDYSKKITLEDEQKWYRGMLENEDEVVFSIILKETDQHIGGTGLHMIDIGNKKASFGIVIGDKTQWGKGIGSEVTRLVIQHGFEQLNLHRIYLTVCERHLVAQQCYGKCGFIKEGTFREDVLHHDGTYHTSVVMGILREEWQELTSRLSDS